ncbi:MAG: LPS assembly lipoprotein LptE [Limisphaerales bacterium]
MRAGFLLAGSLALLILPGCVGYRVGPSSGVAAGSRSVQVNFFRNRTLEPRLSEAVGSALRKNLQQDGTYRLDTHGTGDIVLDGVIISYDRAALTFQPNDILTVRDYVVELTASITARDRSTGKVFLERNVTGRTTIRVGSDQASAERQALPLLADDLAKNAASLLVDGVW